MTTGPGLWPPETSKIRTFDVHPPLDSDRPILSPVRVTELVEEYRRHRISSRDAHRCTCGELWQCARKRLAWGELYEAGQAAEIWLRGTR